MRILTSLICGILVGVVGTLAYPRMLANLRHSRVENGTKDASSTIEKRSVEQRSTTLRPEAVRVQIAPHRPKAIQPESSGTIRLEDIQVSEQIFLRAVYDLTFNGNLSSNLEMLARLGVPFQGRDGHARDFREVTTATAAALQRAVDARRMNQQEAYYAAREAGFYGSVATAISINDPKLESALKAAKARTATP